MPDTAPIALITGASGGIGALYAERLARRGYDLILVARDAERLRDMAGRIAGNTRRNVSTMSADLADPDALHEVEALLRGNPRISMLVNNAGFGAVTPLLGSDPDRMQFMIEVNVTALTRLAYAVAPGFVERGSGTIINIASTVALAPELLNGVYGASKAYVLAFTQSLQHELADKGVRIQAVLPGATGTAFWDVAGIGGAGNLPAEWVMSAEELVDAALAGLDAGEVVTIPPLQDGEEWTRYDAMRRDMGQRLANAHAAPRYHTRRAA
jgi:short-subunit dehydrogenase